MGDAQQMVTTAVVAVLVALGAVVAAAGLRLWLRSRRLGRRATARAEGVVEGMVDRGPGSGGGRRLRRDEKVLAANEAIAAKKRAYAAKMSAARRREGREGLATWHPRVRWAPAGGEARVTEGARGMRARALRAGQRVMVRYDPRDPGLWYLEAEGTGSAAGLTLLVAGVALVALGAVCWFAFPWLAASQA